MVRHPKWKRAKKIVKTNACPCLPCAHPICNNCAAPREATPDEIDALALDDSYLGRALLRRGAGCGDCRGTGYRGRIAIAEILVLNDVLRELIVNKASIVHIKAEARRGGTRLLRDAALDLAQRGQTTLEEVLRVTLQG